MLIEKNTFNNLVNQIDRVRLFRQFYMIYPQINQVVPDKFKLINQKSQTVTDQFKLENLKIQQTVSVNSLKVAKSHLFVSKYKINLPSVEEIEAFLSHEMEEF